MNAPLTDEQIKEMHARTSEELVEKWRNHEGGVFMVEFARAIERAHGIGE